MSEEDVTMSSSEEENDNHLVIKSPNNVNLRMVGQPAPQKKQKLFQPSQHAPRPQPTPQSSNVQNVAPSPNTPTPPGLWNRVTNAFEQVQQHPRAQQVASAGMDMVWSTGRTLLGIAGIVFVGVLRNAAQARVQKNLVRAQASPAVALASNPDHGNVSSFQHTQSFWDRTPTENQRIEFDF